MFETRAEATAKSVAATSLADALKGGSSASAAVPSGPSGGGSGDGGRVDGSNPLFLIADLLEEAGAKGDDPDR
jgi:hypothetical protein